MVILIIKRIMIRVLISLHIFQGINWYPFSIIFSNKYFRSIQMRGNLPCSCGFPYFYFFGAGKENVEYGNEGSFHY